MAGTWVRGLHAVRAGCGCLVLYSKGRSAGGVLRAFELIGYSLLIGNFGRCFLHGLGSEVYSYATGGFDVQA